MESAIIFLLSLFAPPGFGKDPHIRVGGPEFGVKLAKSRILQYFETKSNRVTMKMDVSYTDHSHIIGKVTKIQGDPSGLVKISHYVT